MATQSEVAAHLFISDRQVRNLITDGILPSSKGKGGLEIEDCRKRYIDYLRGQKTGQVKAPDDDEFYEEGAVIGGINVDYEDARKKQLDADTREFKLKQLRKEFVPIDLLVYSVSKLSEMLVANVLSLPMKMKVADPSLSARSLDKSKQVIADLCNELANFDIDLSDYNPVDQDIDTEGP
jgi:phage terminase Nu1 subunit (DNA packaging protein)